MSPDPDIPPIAGHPSFRVPTACCPRCMEPLGAATSTVKGVKGLNRPPQAGDVSMCFGCSEFLTFDEALMPQRLSLSRFNTLDLYTQQLLLALRVSWQEYQKK